jgi:hypothetical protein
MIEYCNKKGRATLCLSRIARLNNQITTLPGAAEADVVVGVRRRTEHTQGKDTGSRAIVPVAAANNGRREVQADILRGGRQKTPPTCKNLKLQSAKLPKTTQRTQRNPKSPPEYAGLLLPPTAKTPAPVPLNQ